MRMLWAAAAVAAGFAPAAVADVPVVDLVGVVHAISASHVVDAIDKADAARAPLLVLRIDTPGGFDASMRQIIDKMLNCRTPVAVFVSPSGARAASAGFLITTVADIAAMSPGTNIGAAHPVSALSGPVDEVMAKKITSDAAAYIRGKVERRGRNAELAEKAVTESRSFTEKEALDAKLIDLIANDVPGLMKMLDGREVKRFDGSVVRLAIAGERTFPVAMNWRQNILSLIARPETLFLLLLGALAGLGTEISHPGLLFPGIVGVLCLILFLFATQIVPVNWAGVLLILAAIAMFAAEVKVPAYGLLTVSGLVAMVLGAMMLVDAPIAELRIPLKLLIPATLAIAAWTFMLVSLVVRTRRLRVTTGSAGLIGQVGVAEEDLGPEGWIRVQGEQWRAVAETLVRAGDRVRVAAVDGLKLRVRKEG